MAVKVKNNQTIFDVAIQHFGSAEAAIDLAGSNNRSITDELEAGMELNEIPVVNKIIYSHFKVKNLQPATGITETDSGILRYFGAEFPMELN
jgi:hypothetical protein